MINLDRFFEFKNPDAIKLLGFDAYTEADVLAMEKQVNFTALAKEIKQTGIWNKQFDDDKTILLYAHCLFNHGILTGEDSNNLGTLVYISL